MKNLVIQTAFLGDLLLCIPLLKNIKKKFPNHSLTLACRKGLGDLFKELNICDEIIELDKKNSKNLKNSLSILKKEEFDYLFCPHQSYRSAFMSFNISANHKIGFYSWWNFFVFSKRIKRNSDLPDGLRQLSLLGLLDDSIKAAIQNYSPDHSVLQSIPRVSNMGLRSQIIAHADYQKIVKKFNLPQNLVFLAPGSVWNTKRWTKEGYREVAQKLSQQSSVVLIGSKEEQGLCAQISAEIPGAVNLAGQTSLFELLVIMTLGKYLICNDSGAMHMASVAELPTIAIFGPTVLELGYQPWQPNAVVVENKNLKCRPCGKHGHDVCPIGTHECMVSISSREVLEKTEHITRDASENANQTP